jgi:hypothetical protein
MRWSIDMTLKRMMHEAHGRRVAIAVAVDPEPGYGTRSDLWPSIGGYPLYDSFLYYSMSNDAVRNDAFGRAFIPAACAGRAGHSRGTQRS